MALGLMKYTITEIVVIINRDDKDSEEILDKIYDTVLSLDDVQDISIGEPEEDEVELSEVAHLAGLNGAVA
ncbi:hypothetical protein [Nocardia niwae]|uniref:hypothetical protein n=1 Tax=Nocardia niwae TaxID=626084 RepID=UPI003405EF40